MTWSPLFPGWWIPLVQKVVSYLWSFVSSYFSFIHSFHIFLPEESSSVPRWFLLWLWLLWLWLLWLWLLWLWLLWLWLLWLWLWLWLWLLLLLLLLFCIAWSAGIVLTSYHLQSRNGLAMYMFYASFCRGPSPQEGSWAGNICAPQRQNGFGPEGMLRTLPFPVWILY